jgi:hypothetical protein
MTLLNEKNYYDSLYDEDDPVVWDPLDSLEFEEDKGLEILPCDLVEVFHSAERICEEMRVPKLYRDDVKVTGMEVGDDRVDRSRDPFRLAIGLTVQELVLHMRTSVEDTTISNSVWNFCEISNGIPTDITETFDFCRKNNGFENLGFVDTPPLRIILDVSKGDGSHSSTASGKAAMLGTRMRTPRTEFLQKLHLASFMQDGMLRTSMSSDPKYLPRIMGGSGCRALYDSADNLFLYTLAYKGGRCNRIYGSAVRELQDCLSNLAKSKASMPVLCRMLSDKQEYLHATYANMIFAPKYSFKDIQMEKLPAPLIESTGGANRFNSTLNRLVRTRHLVTRTVAIREWEYSKTIRARLLSRLETKRLDFEETARKQELRKQFGYALTANTAFAHLLARKARAEDVEALLKSEYHLTITSGAPEFSIWDAQWLVSGAKYEDYSIEDLTITEDLHSREDVSEEKTFKVGGLLLRPIVGDKVKAIKTTTKIGLYEINSSMEEWAERTFQRILSHRKDGPVPRDAVLTEIMKDPEWVNDDTGLIELCLRDTQALHQRSARVVLVSQDKRLANQMSNTCNVQVERLHPLSYVLAMMDEGLDPINDREKAHSLLKGRIPNRERADPIRAFYVDTGSVAQVLSNLEDEGVGEQTDIKVRAHLDSGVRENGQRWTKYALKDIPRRVRDLQTVPIRPVLRDRRFPHRQSDASSGGRPRTWSRSVTS